MTILAYVVGVLILAWVSVPLFRKDSTWISLYLERDDLNDHKRQVYGNIADLEFDYAMGRLSEADFNSIRHSFLAEAGRVIERLENHKSSAIAKQIEQDITKLDRKRSGKHKAGKRTVRAAGTCPNCGVENPVEAQFCMSCGKELK